MGTEATPVEPAPWRSRPRVGGVRSPSVAELVAAQLRERIVAGELTDGDVLPKQEDLLAEFGVSKPSLREALRILEAEGLVQVRRGKVGGAVVQRPRVDSTAQGIEVALRSKGVGPAEVAHALRLLEPVCAGLCAARGDRRRTVVPRLRRAHEEAAAAVDDVARYVMLARRFHEEVVACCGDETITFVLSALEAICSEDAVAWARSVADGGPQRRDPILRASYRKRSIEDHARLLEAIEAGDVEGAEREARNHALTRRGPLAGRPRRRPA